jgi:hypothetical protein
MALAVSAQEPFSGPYTGNQRFQNGDLVQATYAGTWTNAEVVGVAEDKYKIHFEGEKYCNNHALDSWISKQYVRPLNSPAPRPVPPPIDPTPPQPQRRDPINPPAPVARGSKVMYRSGSVLWFSGAKIEAYDAQNRQYRLRLDSGSGDIVPCHSVVKPGESINNDFYIGKWDVRNNGAT